MPEETMTVTATPISPSGVDSGPSRPGGSLVAGISPGPAITFPSGNGVIITLQNEPLDTKQHTLSSISTTDGEIPYDEWVFVETSGKRILTDEGDITYVLQLLQNVGDSWANNGIDLVFGDNQYLRFDSKSSLVSFLENSNRIVKYDFIQEKEGFSTSGYVPKGSDGNPDGNSGVTVGSGVDLGNRTSSSMINDGIDRTFAESLNAYFGLKGQDAQNQLNSNPLNLTYSQATDLSNFYINKFSTTVASSFNNATSSKFSSLPLNTRTAIVSVAYQYGTNLASATPNFWSQVTNGQWQEAINNLNNFGDAYPTRRRSEAALIQSDLDAGKLP
ncbi:pesticin C-terminus-like muramidase [Klebsiella pneumoniae]|uniref:Pesticin C-terminus-like muramidase n=4 Tax=Klebsiella pneumoniae TaxID=573 RepID=A0A658ZZU9_KLEPN|nr:pesticin C-terminus-like muramidase [Klebsiella pneumoniae]HAJ3307077.1 hypothetical protein [Escherichia coli]HBX3811693.1 hypothetical protein [Klebsiella pneumoniae subsp. pneumoniae]HCN3275754.1 hypothetical protein [Klebsiella michiganensis]AZG62758.1 hypothetical protein EHF43_29005 [Klebsiella pneumoniae]AZG68334.1 hypothetical protein EHF42_29470 [Klebsiella pneumoniae]